MLLSNFLPTVPELTPEQKRDAAKVYPLVTGHILEASSVNGVLTDLDLIDVVHDVAQDKTHPARVKMLGVYTGLIGNHQFNFIQNTFTGERAIAQLNWLITTGLPEHAQALTQFRDIMIWRANVVSYPLINTTLHDVLVTEGTCPVVPLVSEDGWAVITTTADAPEAHRPQLSYLNPRTNKVERATNFPLVTVAGTYECQVPSFAFGNSLFVDNAYGVL